MLSYALVALAAAQAASLATVDQAAPAVEAQATVQAAPATTVAPVASQVVESAQPAPVVNQAVPVAPAAVSSIRKGIALWRNIEDGMSVAQLRALYPQGSDVNYKADRTVLTDVPIMEGCQAKVNVMHPAGIVKEIVMRGEGAIAGRCSVRIITALSGKYGEPMDKDKVKGSLFGREGKNYIWSHDGLTMQFKRYTNGAFGGGGLLAASWEMRYTANSTNIDM